MVVFGQPVGGGCVNENDKTASEGNTIEYANDLAKDMSVDSYVRTYEEEGTYAYYAVKNNSQMLAEVEITTYYYDKNGYQMAKRESRMSGPRYGGIQPGGVGVYEEYGVPLDYKSSRTVIEARGYEYREEDVRDKIKIEQTETESGINAGLTNTSEKTIGDVYLTALYYDSNGKLIGYDNEVSKKLYGPGYTDTVNFRYPYEGNKYNPSTGRYEDIYTKAAKTQVYVGVVV